MCRKGTKTKKKPRGGDNGGEKTSLMIRPPTPVTPPSAVAHLRAAAQELLPHLSELLYLLGAPVFWLLQFLRLAGAVMFMLPYMLPVALVYLFSPSVRRGLRYGESVRHAIDVYMPLDQHGNELPTNLRSVVAEDGECFLHAFSGALGALRAARLQRLLELKLKRTSLRRRHASQQPPQRFRALGGSVGALAQ